MSKTEYLTRAPFGFSTKRRFHDIRQHPRWRYFPLAGTEDEILAVGRGPGSYEIEQSIKNCIERKLPRSFSLKKAFDTEREAKAPKIKRSILFEKLKYLTKPDSPGVGDYQIKNFLQLDDERPKALTLMGPIETRDYPRFKEKMFATPSPNEYGYPIRRLESLYNAQKSSKGVLNSLTQRKTNSSNAWSIAPNTYNIPSAVNEALNKVVSHKRPLVFFSKNRDNSSIYGKLSELPKSGVGPADFGFPSFTDELKRFEKAYYGKFRTAKRFPYRVDFIGPGPLEYSPKMPSKPGPVKWAPFLVGTERKSVFEDKFGYPGPGRFSITKPRVTGRKKGNNTSSFRAVGRPMCRERERFLKFRMEAKNMPVPQRSLYKYDYVDP